MKRQVSHLRDWINLHTTAAQNGELINTSCGRWRCQVHRTRRTDASDLGCSVRSETAEHIPFAQPGPPKLPHESARSQPDSPTCGGAAGSLDVPPCCVVFFNSAHARPVVPAIVSTVPAVGSSFRARRRWWTPVHEFTGSQAVRWNSPKARRMLLSEPSRIALTARAQGPLDGEGGREGGERGREEGGGGERAVTLKCECSKTSSVNDEMEMSCDVAVKNVRLSITCLWVV